MILTSSGPVVFGFKGGFGDQETQSLIPLLKSDLAELLFACVEGYLDKIQVNWHRDHCAVVVLTAQGYPGNHEEGAQIQLGIDRLNNSVFPRNSGVQC